MRTTVLHSLLPFLDWFREYDRDSLKADLSAGLTVALVLIPQSMAYAQLAGLPPHYGLYAAFLPPMVAALFGSSRRLATGPVAVVSIMTAATLEPLATAGSQEYIAAAILLAFLVGLFQLLLGLLKLGVVVNLLSHPVTTGFTNGAALIIASSQLTKLFGIHVEQAPHHYQTMARVVAAAADFIHWPTLGLGLLAMATMIILKKWRPRAPNVLVAVVLTTVISWATGFADNRTVTLAELQVEGLPELVRQLESNLEHIRQAAQAKRSLPMRGSLGEKDLQRLCGRCHTLESLGRGEYPWKTGQPHPVTLENVLELHFMAGVMDEYISVEKEHARRIRARLRSFKLMAEQQPDGRIIYRPWSSESADGHRPVIWRIRVPNSGLDPDRLVLIGGGEVIGAIPPGIPRFGLPRFNGRLLPDLLLPALVITLLGFMEAISVAKAIAARTGCRLDPNRELIGQGLANIIGSLGSSYPVSGSFSRSAVNFQAGAQTGMSSVFTGLFVLTTLYLFTPLLHHLPQSVLAAIIMVAVAGLINIRDVIHAWKVSRSDGVIAIITFGATLVFAPHLDRAILLGVFLSIAVFFYRHMRPVIAELSLWEDGHFRSAERLHLRVCPHIVVLRFDGPLFFANISYLEQSVLSIIQSRDTLKIIHLKCNGINEVDASGENALRLLIDRLHAAGYEVYFSGLKLQIIDIFRRSGLLRIIGEDHIFPTLAQAMEVIWPRTHAPGLEPTCPLKTVLTRDESLVSWEIDSASERKDRGCGEPADTGDESVETQKRGQGSGKKLSG